MSFADVIRYAANPESSAYADMGGDASVIWLGVSEFPSGPFKIYELSVIDFSTVRSSSLASYAGCLGGKSNVIWDARWQPIKVKISELSIVDFSIIRDDYGPTTERVGCGGDPNVIWFSFTLLYKLSVIDFSVEFQGAPPASGRSIGGTALTIWYSGLTAGLLYQLSPSDFSVIQSGDRPQVAASYGMGGDDSTIWYSDQDYVYELDAVTGGTEATIGTLWVEDEELHYGDGEGWERYFEGFDTGETGTAGGIGYKAGGTVLRYTSKTGKIREINLEDMGLDIAAGQIGYEGSGTRLRHADAGGYKREKEGMLV